MSLLADILTSKARAEIFRLLFGASGKELHMRELERQSGLTIGTVSQDLKKLKAMDLIKARKDGNRIYYRANNEHPLYHDIRNLVLKTDGLVEVLKSSLKAKEIRVAFVYGSIASNNTGAHSDIDLMVIGNLTLRKVIFLLAGISQKIGREINPQVLNIKEFIRRKHSGDHFLTSVLGSQKIFIVGNKDELKTMGE